MNVFTEQTSPIHGGNKTLPPETGHAAWKTQRLTGRFFSQTSLDIYHPELGLSLCVSVWLLCRDVWRLEDLRGLTAAQAAVRGELQSSLGAVPSVPCKLILALLYATLSARRHTAGVDQIRLQGQRQGTYWTTTLRNIGWGRWGGCGYDLVPRYVHSREIKLSWSRFLQRFT